MDAHRAGGLPGHARRRHRDLRRRRRPARGGRERAAPAPLRRGRAARGLELDLARDARAARASGSPSRHDARLPGPRPARPRTTSSQLYELDRPDLKYEPWVPYTQRRLAKPKDGDLFAEIARGRHRRPAPLRLVRDERRGLRPRRARTIPRSSTLKTTVYRTSDDSALAPALIEAAENGKQSVCVVELKARFDERAQHRMGALARAGGRPRRLRLPGPEDPREDDARRPPRGRRAPPLRPHRHRQLPRDDRAPLRGRRPLHRRPGHRRRRRRPLQLRHRLRPPAARSASCSSRRSTSARELVEHIRAVADAAAAGEHARIRIKVNNLTDPAIVEELYRASQAGAEIDLIVRARLRRCARASPG